MIFLRMGSILLIIGGAVLLSLRRPDGENTTVYQGEPQQTEAFV